MDVSRAERSSDSTGGAAVVASSGERKSVAGRERLEGGGNSKSLPESGLEAHTYELMERIKDPELHMCHVLEG